MLKPAIYTQNSPINVLLVDDDGDDFLFFKKALDNQVFNTKFSRVISGDKLTEILNDESLPVPDIIFLDVNMPGKNGYDCVIEMKESKRLDKIPIVMYSTCYQEFVADVLFNMGANFYIKKPVGFSEIKNVIHKALCFVTENKSYSPTRANFVL